MHLTGPFAGAATVRCTVNFRPITITGAVTKPFLNSKMHKKQFLLGTVIIFVFKTYWQDKNQVSQAAKIEFYRPSKWIIAILLNPSLGIALSIFSVCSLTISITSSTGFGHWEILP